MKYSRALAALFLATSIVAPSSGQSGRRLPAARADGTPAVRSQDGGDDGAIMLGTSEVLLSVTVRDAEGAPVAHLTRDDFIVAEDQKRQEIVSFTTERAPVNVLLLLDASGSVFTERESIRRAAANFAERLGPEDRISVMQFADKVELIQDWTADRESVRHALNWRFKSGEATAFWDAVYLAASDQLSKVEGRRALIVLTDGDDTSSKVSESQARGALDRADTSVYVVSKAEALLAKMRQLTGFTGTIAGVAGQARNAAGRLLVAQERLKALADRYGGRVFSPMKESELERVYAQVADELKQQYVITYSPPDADARRDGAWHSVDVFLTKPGLAARTRKGYVAK